MAAKTAKTTQERIGRVGRLRQPGIPRDMLRNLKLEAGEFVDNALTTSEVKKVRQALKQIRGEDQTAVPNQT